MKFWAELSKGIVRINTKEYHGRAEIICDNGGQISFLKFVDYDQRSSKTFEAKIPIDDMKTFSLQLLNTVIKGMEAPNP